MEYADQNQALGYAPQGLGNAGSRPADLNALCQQLERHTERVREAAERIRVHGDRMFGSRPEAATSMPQTAQAPTLANLIEQLGEQIAAIESGLNRL